MSLSVHPEYIERNESILHPESVVAGLRENEKHPIAVRDIRAAAESEFPRGRRRRELDGQGRAAEFPHRESSGRRRPIRYGKNEEDETSNGEAEKKAWHR